MALRVHKARDVDDLCRVDEAAAGFHRGRGVGVAAVARLARPIGDARGRRKTHVRHAHRLRGRELEVLRAHSRKAGRQRICQNAAAPRRRSLFEIRQLAVRLPIVGNRHHAEAVAGARRVERSGRRPTHGDAARLDGLGEFQKGDGAVGEGLHGGPRLFARPGWNRQHHGIAVIVVPRRRTVERDIDPLPARDERLRPRQRLHRQFRRDPRAAARRPARAIVHGEFQAQPVGFARGVAQQGEVLRAAVIHRAFGDARAHLENLKAAATHALHGFQVAGDPDFRDVPVHPVPPGARQRGGRRIAEGVLQRGGAGGLRG